MAKPGRWSVAIGIALLLVMSPAAAGPGDGRAPLEVDWERGYVLPILDSAPLSLQSTDPLGLLPDLGFIRQHSLGTDTIDVWTCDLGVDVSNVVAQLDAEVVPYFQWHSRGRYQIDFVPRGNTGGGEQACYDHAAANASGGAEGVLFAGPWSGGVATPGNAGPSFPSNSRWAFVGFPFAASMVATHELGHTISWPHSFTKVSGSDYDNAVDLMSGNLKENGSSNDLPYDTAVINRYAAGWIDPGQVVDLGTEPTTIEIQSSNGDGVQMGVIRAGDKYYTLGSRVSSAYDPIPASWQGIEVYEVTPCPSTDIYGCLADPRFGMGFREVVPLGQVPFQPGAVPGHIIRPGDTRVVGGRTLSVESYGSGSYFVSVGEGSGQPPSSGFADTVGHVFAGDIDWLAEAGITKGCNPPSNTLFCPDASVTRGQMAAFLHRALPDLPAGTATDFADDDGSVFEADIEWLAATGVTRGCNPPANDRFCPDQIVTRGQMAAFLHRALPDLPADTATDFVDDDGSVFEADIEWLAATGVTRGCNPPANSQFCPASPVTRGAMAAFLQRALGG